MRAAAARALRMEHAVRVRFRLVVVGRPRDAALASAIADYEKRAARYWPLDVMEVRGEPARSRSEGDVRRREGARILERLTSSRVVVCDEHGTRHDSAGFARWLQTLREGATDVDFVIGGAFGLDEAVRARAWKTIALAPWTLSHELARLVLAEQLYRAGTILRGEPYHK